MYRTLLNDRRAGGGVQPLYIKYNYVTRQRTWLIPLPLARLIVPIYRHRALSPLLDRFEFKSECE